MPNKNSLRGNVLPSVKNKLWVVIPAFNAEDWIASLIEQITEYVHRDQVVVIDDGSCDSTAEIARSLNIIVVQHTSNAGKGTALRSGFTYIKERGANWAITIDADLQHDPACLPEFMKYAETQTHDLIIGCRKRSGGAMPMDRRFSNWSTSLLLSWVTGTNILDAQSGYRMLKVSFLEGMSFTSSKYDFETELLLKYVDKGARLAWVQIPTIYDDSTSSINRVSDTFRFVKLVSTHLFSKLARSYRKGN